MTKRSLQWHRECLVNLTASRDRLRAEAEEYRRRAEKTTDEVVFRTQQIAEAERRGLAEFDPDKFMKPRKVQT